MKININYVYALIALIAVGWYFDVIPSLSSTNFNEGGFINTSTETTIITDGARAPSGVITINVEPNPSVMGDMVWGNVITNGIDYPIRVSVTHLGTGDETIIDGTLDGSGQFYMSRNLDTPGIWRFQVSTDTISSNVVDLSVHGLIVNVDQGFCSKVIGNCVSIDFEIFSHHIGTHEVWVSKDGWMTMTHLATVTTNAGGYVSGTMNMASLSNGNYEIDVGHPASDDSAWAWGSTDWITVGR